MSEQQLDNLSLSFGGLHLSITTRPTSSSSSVTSHVGVPTTPFSSSWVERENFAFQQGQYYYSLLRGLELPTLPEIPVRPSSGYWVVLRGKGGELYNPPVVKRLKRDVAPFITYQSGKVLDPGLLVGFPSQREVREFLRGAELQCPQL